MKSKIKKTAFATTFAIVFALLFDSLTQAQAQKTARKNHHEKKGIKQELLEKVGEDDLKAMRQELRQYAKQNIMPTIRQQREKLDAYLSPSEVEQISKIREAIKANHIEVKLLRKQTTDRAQFTEMRAKIKPQHDQAQVIAQKYEAQINELQNEIEPQKTKWRADIQLIIQKYVKDIALVEKLSKKEVRHFKFNKKVTFLLLKNKKGKTKNTAKTDQVKAKIYPNPSQQKHYLDINLVKTGKVTIQVFDGQGNQVKTVFEGIKEQGKHTFEVDNTGLQKGNYTYIINNDENKISKKLIIN